MKKSQVTVKDVGEEIYFPKDIPKAREDIMKYKVLFVVLTSAFCLAQCFHEYIVLLTAMAVCCLAHEIVKRFMILLEEKNHLKSRYGGEWMNLTASIFSFSPSYIFITTLWSVVVYLQYKANFDLNVAMLNVEFYIFVIVFINGLFISEYLHIDASPLKMSLAISDLRRYGLDFGSSMAYAYFYGFLNIVLNRKHDSKDIIESIDDFADQNKVEFASKKLFLLIPSSAKCKHSLSEFNGIEVSKTLEEIKMTRAAAQDRVYKVSVYKLLLENGKKRYVCSEFASPLKTMEEVIMDRAEHSEYYSMFKMEIVLNFYLTMRDILKNKQMEHLVELIFYHDTNNVDMRAEILNRIAELNRNKNQ